MEEQCMPGSSGTAARETQIQKSSSNLQETVERLTHQVESLEKALNPILRARIEKPEENTAEATSQKVKLAETIDGWNRRIDSSVTSLINIRERLEL